MLRLTLLAAACAAALPAFAATAAPVSEVIVTATRLDAPLDVTPGARVVTEDEIDARQAIFAADVLDTVPGLSVYRTGAFGGVTSVSQRGAPADKTLVLIDGVPVNDPSQPAGGFDFGSLDLGDVSRIEILSGPQGSLWGSDAIGGVIAFTTRELNGLRANLEGGSYATFRGSAAVGHTEDRWAAGISLSGLTTDGISKADKRDGNTEKDGFQTYTVSANGRLKLTDRITLDGRVRYNDADVDTDGYSPDFVFMDTAESARSRSWQGFARIRAEGPLDFRQSFSVSGYRIDRANLGGAYPSSFTADREVYRWMAERGDPDSLWGAAFGAEREATKASLSDGTEADLGAGSLFGVVRLHPLERLTATASLRFDDPDEYKGQFTGRFGAVLDLIAGFSATASFGQGFKTPTVSETVCDYCYPSGPSLGLKPERAEGWDLGLAWRSPDDRFSASVTGYRLSVRDQISYVFNSDDFSSRYVNLARTSTDGLEVEGEAALGAGFRLKAEYAYTDAVDRTTGIELSRVPLHSGSFSLLWSHERLHGAFTLRGEGEQRDSDPNTFDPAVRKGFVTADLAGSYAITKTIEVTGRIENLTDKHYQEVLGYGEPGRSAYIGLRFRS